MTDKSRLTGQERRRARQAARMIPGFALFDAPGQSSTRNQNARRRAQSDEEYRAQGVPVNRRTGRAALRGRLPETPR